MKMNLEDMTIGEMVLFEETAGIPMGELVKHQNSMKVIRALVFIQARREDPKATLADVDAMSMTDIEADEPDVEETTEDPTGPDA